MKDAVQFENQGQPAAVRLEVRPLKKRNGKKQDLLVVFQKVEPAKPRYRSCKERGKTPEQRNILPEKRERSNRNASTQRTHARLD